MTSNPSKDLLGAIFKLRRAEYSRCFAPNADCKQEAIRAHSVQNAAVLDHLAEGGHLIAPTTRMDSQSGVSVEFLAVGRNRATTFAGLCAEHDAALFGPIERSPLSLDDLEHRFLLAYRAVLYELHASSAAAWLLQSGYTKKVQLGLDSGQEMNPASVMATHRMMVAYETFMYKLKYDAAYVERDFSVLDHDILVIPVNRPTVAASTLFSLDHLQRGDDTVRVCLTILPTAKTETTAVFSYTKEDAPYARKELASVLTPSRDQALALSIRLLNNCQNFVLAPSFYQEWSSEKTRAVTEFFTNTLFHDKLDHMDPRLQMLDAVA